MGGRQPGGGGPIDLCRSTGSDTAVPKGYRSSNVPIVVPARHPWVEACFEGFAARTAGESMRPGQPTNTSGDPTSTAVWE
jgi:hypothetical protein